MWLYWLCVYHCQCFALIGFHFSIIHVNKRWMNMKNLQSKNFYPLTYQRSAMLSHVIVSESLIHFQFTKCENTSSPLKYMVDQKLLTSNTFLQIFVDCDVSIARAPAAAFTISESSSSPQRSTRYFTWKIGGKYAHWYALLSVDLAFTCN